MLYFKQENWTLVIWQFNIAIEPIKVNPVKDNGVYYVRKISNGVNYS